jgi:hypothetical protein
MSQERVRQVEAEFRNTDEAFELLGLIAVEFQTDPTSTQCFDSRIIDRVKKCVAARINQIRDRGF